MIWTIISWVYYIFNKQKQKILSQKKSFEKANSGTYYVKALSQKSKFSNIIHSAKQLKKFSQ